MRNESYSSYLEDDKIAFFLFHGVIPKNKYVIRNCNHKHLSENYFTMIIQDLCRNGQPLPIDRAVELIAKNKELPKKSFVISFDDGFENNYLHAMPILKKEKVPSVFYITTSWLETFNRSWIDDIEFCFEYSNFFKIKLPWRNEIFKIKDKVSKIEILKEIRFNVKNDKKVNVKELVKDIIHASKVDISVNKNPELDNKLTYDEIREMNNDNLFTIGAHTHSHQILSFLSLDNLNYEVKKSIEILENVLQSKIIHFSYPEGMKNTYNKKVISLLKKSGIVCCPTAINGLNSQNDSLFELKRINVT